MIINYEFNDDDFCLEVDENLTVAQLRNRIHTVLELNETMRKFDFTHGDIKVPGQTKLKSLDGNIMFHYRRKNDTDINAIATLSIDDPFSSFYHDLMLGNVCPDGFIRWPSPLPVFDISSILIRKCYGIIYDSILQSRNVKTRVVVTGVPGIGKSLFALYFAWRYCTENPGKGFLLEKSADEIWVFDPRYPFRVSKRSNAHSFRDMPYLVDLNEKRLPGDCIGCFGVVFSSPCDARFKEWVKNPDISDRYVMETWSISELETVLKNNVTCDYELERVLEKMLQRYEKVGGVPRLVLQGSDDHFNGKLTNALSLKGSGISEKFFVGGLGNKDDDMSYLLVHVHPLNHGTNEVDYKTWLECYTFASPHIRTELYKA
jgi:hypothetical protein